MDLTWMLWCLDAEVLEQLCCDNCQLAPLDLSEWLAEQAGTQMSPTRTAGGSTTS